MMSGGRSMFPFTATQWQELEHQALIFKYMVSGMPIPPDLLYTIRRSLASSSLSSKLILHQPQHIGWNCFQMDFGRKIDPEPGRCRRTDGKKWRCSKEAYPDSKYCERHMHRGRNRSRKPVEVMTTTTTTTATAKTTTTASANNNTSTRIVTPTAIPISSITNKDSDHSYSTFSPTSHHSVTSPPFAYSHSSSSSRPPGLSFSSQDNMTTTNFLLESSAAYSHSSKDNRNSSYGHGMKEEVGQHSFLSDASVPMRSSSLSGSSVDETWHLTMGSYPPLMGHLNQRSLQSGHHQSYLQLQSLEDNNTTSSSQQRLRDQDHQQHYYVDDHHHHHRPKKVMHHFFDEWPPKDNKDSWLDDSEDKLSINDVPLSKTQLSISMPNSARDFFITQTDK